ncbi:hypothetical protein [Caldicellulosiruptor naganoensis]|uniref:Lipoprotein n=1 Tax=Caldicellulosiruptor naganoensis TaxID=29324 RepID=A0ABY7BGQ5_9FIRM|nr:hypothetical protein [Caldicellulosiruptor naganoensis]WAM31769.1 hypothetical protein OTJ99_000221 [Caldicellulosiruptor naganoensis]
MRIKKSNSNKKWILGLIIGVILGLVGGVVAGYYISSHIATQKQQVSSPASTQQQSQAESTTSSGVLPQTSKSQQNQQQAQEGTNLQKPKTYKAYGRYLGEADRHSIEVNLLNTSFDYKTFEFEPANIQKYNLQPGQIVELEFEEPHDGRNPKITNLNVPDEITLKGKFIGLADNNFAEFLFDQKHVVLQITAVSDKISYLDENTDVEVTFKTNPQDPNSNPVVTDIKILK